MLSAALSESTPKSMPPRGSPGPRARLEKTAWLTGRTCNTALGEKTAKVVSFVILFRIYYLLEDLVHRSPFFIKYGVRNHDAVSKTFLMP